MKMLKTRWYVQLLRIRSDGKAIVMNISGVKACFYWAEFPKGYLTTVRKRRLGELRFHEKIPLHHTKPRDLTDVEDRGVLIQEFIGIVRCLADGKGKIGHLRRDPSSPIHERHYFNDDERK